MIDYSPKTVLSRAKSALTAAMATGAAVALLTFADAMRPPRPASRRAPRKVAKRVGPLKPGVKGAQFKGHGKVVAEKRPATTARAALEAAPPSAKA